MYFHFRYFSIYIYPLKTVCVWIYLMLPIVLYFSLETPWWFSPATGGEHQQYALPRDFRRFRNGSKSVEVGRLWATRCPGNFKKDHLFVAEVVFHWVYADIGVLNICKFIIQHVPIEKNTDLYFLRNQFLEPFWIYLCYPPKKVERHMCLKSYRNFPIGTRSSSNIAMFLSIFQGAKLVKLRTGGPHYLAMSTKASASSGMGHPWRRPSASEISCRRPGAAVDGRNSTKHLGCI